MLCQDRCGYCTFAKPPARLRAGLPESRAGARHRARRCRDGLSRGPLHARGASRAALPGRGRTGSQSTASPRPSTTSPSAAASCEPRPACFRTRTPGRSIADELAQLREVAVSQGMMLESLAPALACHRASPDKTPAAPPRHLGGGGPAPDRLHDGHPRRHRGDPAPTASRPCGPSPPATPATATCRR